MLGYLRDDRIQNKLPNGCCAQPVGCRSAQPRVLKFPTGECASCPFAGDNPRVWKWNEKCMELPNFAIDSELPRFLTYQAWDSTQGGASSSDLTDKDETAESYQVIGGWQRMTELEAGGEGGAGRR